MTQTEWASVLIALLSLVISAATAWLTLIRKGTVRMTRPTLVYLGPDGAGGPPKVLVSALLYATAARGVVLESMHVVLQRSGRRQPFTRWGYGDFENPASRGLYVDREGVATNHHFLLPSAQRAYVFQEGDYVLETFATPVGSGSAVKLSRVEFTIPHELAEPLADSDSAVLFSWNPDIRSYDLEFLDASDPYLTDAS